jgi:hypothetical protein
MGGDLPPTVAPASVPVLGEPWVTVRDDGATEQVPYRPTFHSTEYPSS